MNDTAFEKQMDTGDLEMVRLGVEHTRLRTRALQYLTMLGVVTVVILALTVVIYNRHDSNNQISELTTQVDNLDQQLTEARAVRSDTDLCQSKFDANVSDAAREANATEHELVVLIATVQPADRATQIGNKVTALDKATEQYRIAGNARSAWVNADKPLPCPI